MHVKFLTPIKQYFKAHLWDILLVFLLALTGLMAGLWANEIILDDAVITYRVAENLAHGQGFVYNAGERIQVTTTPLYAMVLAIGTWIFGSAPRAALVLNIALSTLIPVLAYDLGRRLSGRITGIAGALLLAFSPFLIMAFSMESYLYVTLILAAMEAYVIGRMKLAGTFAGFTAIVRGDGALLGAVMLFYDLLAHRRLRWRLIIPTVTIPAIWYLFAWGYYGSPFPATLGAKVAQGEFNWLGERFLDGMLSYWADWTQAQGPILYLIPVLIILGLIPIIRAERPWLIMIGRDALYLTAFVALGVPTAEWYYAPLAPGIAMITARGIQFLADAVGNGITKISKENRWALIGSRYIPYITAAILLTLLLSAIYPISKNIIHQNPDWKAKVYPDTARWIAQNTNSSANFSTIDIGHLGYWSGRRIIDIVGLAQPDVSPHIAEGDFGYAIRHYQPDMIVIGYSWIPEVQRTEWFQTSYAPRHYFKFSTINEPLVLFSRMEGVKVQPDSVPVTNIRPLQIDFNQQFTLTGAHINPLLTPGTPLNLTLFWQVDSPIEVDFTVFVQIIDADGNIIAQKDSKPQNGFYSTPYWQPGENIIDVHTVLIPDNIPPGSYDIVFGLYEAETGHRLQILDETGTFKNDHVRLTDINIDAP